MEFSFESRVLTLQNKMALQRGNIVTLLKRHYPFFKQPPCRPNTGMKPPPLQYILLMACLLNFSNRCSPDYSFLKTFGCLCHPYLRPYTPNKLTSRSDQCLFLGYSGSHRGYRCLSLQIGKLFISRRAMFTENTFPCALLSTTVPSDSSSLGLIGSHPSVSHPPTSFTLSQDSQNNTPTPPPASTNTSTSSNHTHESPSHASPLTSDPSPNPISSTTDSASLTLNPLVSNSLDLPIALRKTPRLNSPKKYFPMEQFQTHFSSKIPRHPPLQCRTSTVEPTSYTFASKNPNWRQAMTEEFNAFLPQDYLDTCSSVHQHARHWL